MALTWCYLCSAFGPLLLSLHLLPMGLCTQNFGFYLQASDSQINISSPALTPDSQSWRSVGLFCLASLGPLRIRVPPTVFVSFCPPLCPFVFAVFEWHHRSCCNQEVERTVSSWVGLLPQGPLPVSHWFLLVLSLQRLCSVPPSPSLLV